MRLALIALAVAFAGCRASSQLGEECAMVAGDPKVDGGRRFLTNGELRASAGKDFISFGSTDCEDLICVRDSDYAPADGGALNPGEVAKGYCSRNCISGAPCPSSSAQLDGDPRTRLNCRPLLLHADTLHALCGSSEGRTMCTAFGSSADFCARGGVGADAGI